jgi:hypothetical protein
MPEPEPDDCLKRIYEAELHKLEAPKKDDHIREKCAASLKPKQNQDIPHGTGSSNPFRSASESPIKVSLGSRS